MTSNLICPFCTFDISPSRGFSLGFQVLVICQECAAEAVEGWKSWRWSIGNCFRCDAKDVRVFNSFPTKIETQICERCVKAAHAYLSGMEPIPEPVKPARQITKAELTSGNQ